MPTYFSYLPCLHNFSYLSCPQFFSSYLPCLHNYNYLSCLYNFSYLSCLHNFCFPPYLTCVSYTTCSNDSVTYLAYIYFQLPTMPTSYNKGVTDLLEMMLVANPDGRPSAAQVLQQSVFKTTKKPPPIVRLQPIISFLISAEDTRFKYM